MYLTDRLLSQNLLLLRKRKYAKRAARKSFAVSLREFKKCRFLYTQAKKVFDENKKLVERNQKILEENKKVYLKNKQVLDQLNALLKKYGLN